MQGGGQSLVLAAVCTAAHGTLRHWGPGVSWDACGKAPEARQLRHLTLFLPSSGGSRLIPPKASRENPLRVLPGSDDPLAGLGVPGLVDTPPRLCLSPHDLPCVSRVPSPYRVTRATLTHCGLNSCPLRPRYHIRPRSEVPGGCELGGGDTQPSRAPLTSDSQPVTAHAPQRRERSRRVSDLRAAPLPRKF